MGTGKLLLSLIAAGLGTGLIAAGAITHTIQSYPQTAGSIGYSRDADFAWSDDRFAGQPPADSWADGSRPLGEVPTWPGSSWNRTDPDDGADWSGRQWRDQGMSDGPPAYAAEAYALPIDDYAPPEMSPSALYDSADRQNLGLPPAVDDRPSSALQRPDGLDSDPATEAAAQASAAAEDVMAVERGGT